MKKKEIKKRINRRHAKVVREIKKYWATAYKEALAQYGVAHAECVALYQDAELINRIAGEKHINQYGLEVARDEANKIELQCINRAYEALRRYLCATCHYQ